MQRHAKKTRASAGVKESALSATKTQLPGAKQWQGLGGCFLSQMSTGI